MTNHTDTSRNDDLVERLRERTSYSEILLCHPPRPAPDRLCHEAADRIEALKAENERLRGALQSVLTESVDIECGDRVIYSDHVNAIRAALGEKQ